MMAGNTSILSMPALMKASYSDFSKGDLLLGIVRAFWSQKSQYLFRTTLVWENLVLPARQVVEIGQSAILRQLPRSHSKAFAQSCNTFFIFQSGNFCHKPGVCTARNKNEAGTYVFLKK